MYNNIYWFDHFLLLIAFQLAWLADSIKIQDLQFDFKPGLSTESAIFCVKQDVLTQLKKPQYMLAFWSYARI